MKFIWNDGGRQAAGFRGEPGDCVARSIVIATGLAYRDVYAALAEGNATERQMKHGHRASGKRTAREGINVTRKWFRDYMGSLGFVWTPTMHIGSGCTVHLRDGELPDGRLVVSLSGHYTAVLDGVVHDTYDPSRDGTRCVYGYWTLAGGAK